MKPDMLLSRGASVVQVVTETCKPLLILLHSASSLTA